MILLLHRTSRNLFAYCRKCCWGWELVGWFHVWIRCWPSSLATPYLPLELRSAVVLPIVPILSSTMRKLQVPPASLVTTFGRSTKSFFKNIPRAIDETERLEQVCKEELRRNLFYYGVFLRHTAKFLISRRKPGLLASTHRLTRAGEGPNIIYKKQLKK